MPLLAPICNLFFKKLSYITYLFLIIFFNLAHASDISISKKFEPTTSKELEEIKVILTISNENLDYDASGGSVTDTLPNGMTVATPLNAVTTNCNNASVTPNGTDQIAITGISVSRFTATPTPCIIEFNVITPRLNTGESQNNFINNIDQNALSVEIDGNTVTNDNPASATLIVKKNELEVSHGFYLDGIAAEMSRYSYYNEGEDLYLVTTIKNDSFVNLTGIAFENSFFNTIVAGVPGSLVTTCNGTVTLIENSPNANQDTIKLENGTLAANSNCEVRVKVDRTASEFFHANQYVSDEFSANGISSDQGFTNPNADQAITRVIGGPRIYKTFCNRTSGANVCTKSLKVQTSNTIVEKYVRLQLTHYNTNVSPYRSVFTDQLPTGMTLATNPDFSVSPIGCTSVTVSGTAGDASISIDATQAPLANIGNSKSAQNSTCYIYAKVRFDASTAGDEYHNTLFAGETYNGTQVNTPIKTTWPINGGAADDTNKGFTSYIETSEIVIFEPVKDPDFAIRKEFITKSSNDLNVFSGQEFSMRLTLTNNSATDITNLNISDDLKTMNLVGNYPISFYAENNNSAATTNCNLSNNGNLGGANNNGDYSTGDQVLTFSGLTVPANSVCTIDIPLIADSSASVNLSYRTLTNTIKASDISYTIGGKDVTHDKNISDYIRLYRRYYQQKTFSPSTIKAGGSSRVTIRFRVYGGTVSDIVDLSITDPLPIGMTLAQDPNATFTCSNQNAQPVGVNILAVPGSSTLSATIDRIPRHSSTNDCRLIVTVNTDESYISTTMRNEASISAKEGPGPLVDGTNEFIGNIYGSLSAVLKVDSLAQLGINKSVSVENLGVGGVVRASIVIDNSLAYAINLTDVTLTDDLRLSGTSELLVVDPANASFEEAPSVAANTCTGATFTVSPDRTKITMSDANIRAGAICIFSFDMTSQKSGTWNNAIKANSLESFEGITNPNPTEKSVSFNGAVTIGTTKKVTNLEKNSNGTYTARYEIGVKNFGPIDLEQVIVNDDLVAVFGNNFSITQNPTIVSQTPNSSITINPNFNGNSNKVIASNGTLPGITPTSSNNEIILGMTVTFTPNKGKFIFDNTAKASGATTNGILITSDDSNDESYTIGNNDNPATDNKPTRISLPQIAVAKSASTLKNNKDGTFTADYVVKVKNYGAVALNNVVVTDNLSTEFSGTNYTISTTPSIVSGAGLSLTTNYNGSSQAQLASGSLAKDAEVIITFSVTFTPISNKTTYNNQAIATAVSAEDASITTSDSSNNNDYEDTSSSSTTDNDDPTDDNSPTPVVVKPSTYLGIAKSASSSMPELDANGLPTGNFVTNIAIVAQNMGEEDLNNVSITDNLLNDASTGTGFGTSAVTGSPSNAGEFKVSNLNVSNGTGANFVLNSAFNGANRPEIASATVLARAAKALFTFTITWRPEENKTLYLNQTKGEATGDVTNQAIRDDSDNGDKPDGNDNGDPSDDSDLTPTSITTNPSIGISKSATQFTSAGSNGELTTNMSLVIKNYGNEALKDVKIVDSLDDATFGFGSFVDNSINLTNPGQYSVSTSLPANSPLALNPNYTGSGANTELISNGTLAIGQVANVTLTITFIPDLKNNRYEYKNTAIANAKGIVSTNNTTDLSTDGNNPDSNGDYVPDESEPTEVSVTALPVIGIAKKATTINNNDGSFTTSILLTIENLGNESIDDVEIVDNLSDEFGTYENVVANLNSPGTFTVSNIIASGLAPITNFTGTTPNTVVAEGVLNLNAKATVSFDITFIPSKINYINQAIAVGVGSVSNKSTKDLSDDGTLVDADGDGNPTESVEDEKTPISITPQPVIGSAKSAGKVTKTGDNTYTIPYNVKVQNIGNEVLSNVNVSDLLEPAFGNYNTALSSPGTYFVSDISATGSISDITLNTDFNGTQGNQNLVSNGSLLVGESFVVSFNIILNPNDSGQKEYRNQIKVSAEGTASGVLTTDLSNDGEVVDTNNNGIANENGGPEGDNNETIIHLNLPPLAVNDTYSVIPGEQIILTPLSGDKDVDGDVLTIISINGTTLTPGTEQNISVSNGTVNVSVTGVITFIPNPGYTGTISFPYTITDGIETATANEIITVNDVINNPPIAENDSYDTVITGTLVTLSPLEGDSDPDGDILSIVSINGVSITSGTAQTIKVSNGIVNVSASGEITFTSNKGFIGNVSFPYVITDGLETATANQYINVTSGIEGTPSKIPFTNVLTLLTMMGLLSFLVSRYKRKM